MSIPTTLEVRSLVREAFVKTKQTCPPQFYTNKLYTNKADVGNRSVGVGVAPHNARDILNAIMNRLAARDFEANVSLTGNVTTAAYSCRGTYIRITCVIA